MKKLFYIIISFYLSNLLTAQIYDFSDHPNENESFTIADLDYIFLKIVIP